MERSLKKMRRLIASVPAIKIAEAAKLPLRTVQRMRQEGIGRQRLDTITALWKWAKGQK